MTLTLPGPSLPDPAIAWLYASLAQYIAIWSAFQRLSSNAVPPTIGPTKRDIAHLVAHVEQSLPLYTPLPPEILSARLQAFQMSLAYLAKFTSDEAIDSDTASFTAHGNWLLREARDWAAQLKPLLTGENDQLYVWQKLTNGWRIHFRDERGDVIGDPKWAARLHYILQHPHPAKPLPASLVINLGKTPGGGLRGSAADLMETGHDGRRGTKRRERPETPPETIENLKQAIDELEKNLDKARSNHDEAETTRLQGVHDHAWQQLRQLLVLPSRDGSADPEKKAGGVLRKCIYDANKKLTARFPCLVKHLKHSLERNQECKSIAYRPDGNPPPDWVLD